MIINAPIKATILSGITGRVMGEHPLEYDGSRRFENLENTYNEINNRMYSRVSLAKIIQATSTQKLEDQTTKLSTAPGGKLLENGQTVFRGETRNYPSGSTSN